MKLLTVLLFIFGIFMCIIKIRIKLSKSDKKIGEKSQNLKIRIKEKFMIYLLNDVFYEYIISIIATVLGVTLAIVYTNYDTERKNCNVTIEFLEILDNELSIAENSIIAITGLNQMGSDEDTDIFENAEVLSMIPLDVILSNDPYASTVSSSTYSALLIKRMALDYEQNSLKNSSDLVTINQHLLSMGEYIEFIRSVIEIELMYQNKNISEQEAEIRINELDREMAREQNEVIKKYVEELEEGEFKSNMEKMTEYMEEYLN